MRFGFKRVLLVSTLFSGLLTFLFPFLIKINVYLGVASRILAGAFSGPTVPVSRSSLTHWAPVQERSRLVALQIIAWDTNDRSQIDFGLSLISILFYTFYILAS